MSRLGLFLFSVLVITIIIFPATASVENLYVEETDGYHYLDNEVLRFDQKRELTIDNVSFFANNVSGTDIQYANITMTTAGTYGSAENVIQPMMRSNFQPTVEFWENGDLKEISWETRLVRIPETTLGDPFSFEVGRVLSNATLGHRRFDQATEVDLFSVALEYFEYHYIDGTYSKVRVNTELTTDNFDNGLVKRTALHLVKRVPSGDVFFDYGYSIKQVNDLYRFFNIFDQPIFWVPAQLGSILLVVVIYIRISRYIKNNKIRIVKGDQNAENPEENREE